VASQHGRIVDLESYRVRRAGEGRHNLNISRAGPPDQDYIAVMSVWLPAVFFMFWPTWVFPPEFADVHWHRGSDGA